MTKILIAFVLFLLISTSNYSQAQNCNCRINFDSLAHNVEQDYIGFPVKITTAERHNYDKFKDSLQAVSNHTNGYGCYLLLKRYLAYFHDPHLDIKIMFPDGYQDTLRSMFANTETLPYNRDSLMAYFDDGKRDNIEGIWESKSFPFKMAIYKDSLHRRKYVGVTWQGDSVFWMPGQVRAEFRDKDEPTTYYNNDHYPYPATYHVENNVLYIDGMSTWQKIFPIRKGSNHKARETVSFRRIDKESVLLTISSFSINNKELLDSIVGANRNAMLHAKYLLIDIRNNGGGHGQTCDTLLPFLYTGPIPYDGTIVRASTSNIAIYKLGLKNPNFDEESKAALQEMISKMEAGKGSLVNTAGPDTLVLNQTLPYPQKIGILINGGTGSTAELFLLWAKNSKKVTILGTHSRGALDFAEIGGARGLACSYYGYTCPMGMAEHKVYPYIDNVGIVPDVKIEEQTKDWIGFALKHLKNKK